MPSEVNLSWKVIFAIVTAVALHLHSTIMPPVLSRPTTTIVSPPSSPKSKRNREYISTSDRLTRGCTGRNTVGRLNSRKVVLEHNDYYDEIIRQIEQVETDKRTGQNRLVSLDNLKVASEDLLCKSCVVEHVEEERQHMIKLFAKHLEKRTDSTDNRRFIHEIAAATRKSSTRRTNTILDKCKINVDDTHIGISSSTKLSCCHNHNNYISPNKTHQGNNRKRFMEYDANAKSIILGYMNGVGGTNLDAMAVLLDLPNGRNLTRNFSRHQEIVGENIRERTKKEMDLALQMELKATVIHEESKEFYEIWKNEDKATRKKIGLTVSYDMGWQRRSSGNNYASLSGHGFLIGVHTRRVIACVVFSKKCLICEKKPKVAKSTGCQSVSKPLTEDSVSDKSVTEGSVSGIPLTEDSASTIPLTEDSASTIPLTEGSVSTTIDFGSVEDCSLTCALIEDSSVSDSTLTDCSVSTISGLETINHSNTIMSDGMTSIPYNDIDDGHDDVLLSTGVINIKRMDHQCTRNYDGSSGAMESDGLLLMMLELEAKYEGQIYLDYVVTDDDTKMKKFISHFKTRPRGKVNIGGCLPSTIPEPNWYADPTHRAKCVAGAFFELTKGRKSAKRAHKLDAFRMKKYYSYYIKQNRSKGIEWLAKHAMAPLNHLFDDHSLCTSSWCHKKRKLEGGVTLPSERDDKGYYRSKVDDAELFEAMNSKYEKYISIEYLLQCCHLYDTQLNEGMNRSVCKYVPKGTNYCTTTSLITRVYLAAGIQLVGNHFFWVSVMRALNLSVPIQTELYLLDLDKRKLRNFCREHDFANMAKRKTKEHEKIREHLESARRDKARDATYTPLTGCDGVGGGGGGGCRRRGVAVNLCKYREWGCGGKKKHKTNKSAQCEFHGILHSIIGMYLSG